MALFTNPEKVEKMLPKEVRKELLENAKFSTEAHFFSNCDDEGYPKDPWKALKKAGTDPVNSVEGLVVWQPFEDYQANVLLKEMECYKMIRYDEAIHAIGVFIAGQKKEIIR